ncbi:MAG: hypothetical protein GY810_10235 [Aureispira sp.]|nr:hypothetical protein [Aureispira sp.]
MKQNRKETAWKKSRKFGDVKGGRKRVKLADNIFKRYHSIERPSRFDELPIYFKDNPSRDFFHPITIEEIQDTIVKLEAEDVAPITHIWLRKIKKTDFEKGETYQSCFITWSGVNLIILNAFPKDLQMHFGTKPSQKVKKFYATWTDQWIEIDNKWYLKWTRESIKQYYLEHLILHEIGHLVDSQYSRFYSSAGFKKQEDFANSYAVVWNQKIKTELINEVQT